MKPKKTLQKPSEKPLNQKQYSKLLTDLKSLIASGRDKVQEDATNQLTLTYWQVGKRIAKEPLTDQSGYKSSIIKELSNELSLEKTTLSRCITFYKTYKTPPNNKNLSWSHYKDLLSVKDEAIRLQLEKQAQDECWSRQKLLSNIKQLDQENSKSKKSTKLPRPTEATYIYQATVKEVIDGDTLLLNIDLGFQVWKEQRVRLAGIDCPELTTKEGKAALNYTRNKLSQITQVIIKTRKIDIYGRYLAHVFYNASSTPKTSDEIFKSGNYLNEEILSYGLAVRF